MATKSEHADEAAQQQVAEDQRPEVDEDDLDVEGHEQQRVDVEREPEAAPGVAEGVDARLVGQALVAVALVPMAEQPGAPIVMNTNVNPAKAKPSTYQSPVTRSSCAPVRRGSRGVQVRPGAHAHGLTGTPRSF